MTPSPVGMRLALLVLLTLSVGARAFGAERETGPDAAAAAAALAAMVPAPTVAFDASAGRLLPADAVLLATLAPPPAPALATGGAVLLQVGGPPPPQLRYYALDALGSVRVTFDAAGNVIGRADYEPFGSAVTASTTGAQPRQQFTGQERDGEVGVDYFGARLYLPAHGRMPSVDPMYSGAVEDPQRWNRYGYALNDPLLYVDPDGRCATKSPGVTFYTCTEARDPAPGPMMGTPSPGQPSLLGNGSGFTDSNSYFLLQYGEMPNFGSQTVASVLHTTLDVAGVAIPGIGDAADLVNAALYLAEGDIENALTAGLGAVPVLGVAATAAKWGARGSAGVDAFRAVSHAESVDIANHGFRSMAGALEGKWFTETVTGAERFREKFPGNSVIVRTTVPRDVYDRSFKTPNLDGLGPCVYIACSDLSRLRRP